MSQEESACTEKELLGFWNRFCVFAVLGVIVAFVVLVRIRLLDIPLERDEGGYAYTAQLMLEGIMPFEKTYDVKMPGLFAVYALIMTIFGHTTAGIHLGLLFFNAATIIVIFFLGRRLLDTTAGLVASASYAVMSLSQNVQGFSANTEQLLLLPALCGILLMLRAIDSGRVKIFFFSGILIGLAFIIKHHAIFFAAFAGFYLVLSYFKKTQEKVGILIYQCVALFLGGIIPFGLQSLIMLEAGLFDKYWYWLFEYPRLYGSMVPISIGLSFLKAGVLKLCGPFLLLWLLAGVGFVGLLMKRKPMANKLFVVAFFAFSVLSVCPSYLFMPHYFILFLPAVALLTGITVSSICANFFDVKPLIIRRGIAVALTVIAVGYAIFAERAYLFKWSPEVISRRSYGFNPFPESMEIANYIKQHTSKDDSIAILGSEPQIFFYSGRRSASAYIYVYPLMTKSKKAKQMQEEMIQQIEQARPKFLVFVNFPYSWSKHPDSEKMIFKWFNNYWTKNYKEVGIIDIISINNTIYNWDEKAVGYSPRGISWVGVFQRKD